MSILKQYSDHIIKTVGSSLGSLLVVEPLNNPTITNNREIKCRGSETTKPCMFYNKERDQCKVCKCFIKEKASSKTNYNPKKLHIEITHCPMGWWDDADIASLYAVK